MNKYLFYPGCSMETSARAYNESLQSIHEPLGIGAGRNPRIGTAAAQRIPGDQPGAGLCPDRPQPGAGSQTGKWNANGGRSCSACYLNLAKADHYMAERPVLG